VLSDDRAGLPNNGPHCCKRGHRRRPASAMIEAPPRVYVPLGKRPLRRVCLAIMSASADGMRSEKGAIICASRFRYRSRLPKG
jgi:hypothetical protein